jgi:SNF family Na+-dependent transporter
MNKTTTNIVGIIILILGLIISGFEIIDLKKASQSNYGMLTVGILNVLIGILILGLSNKNRNK